MYCLVYQMSLTFLTVIISHYLWLGPNVSSQDSSAFILVANAEVSYYNITLYICKLISTDCI